MRIKIIDKQQEDNIQYSDFYSIKGSCYVNLWYLLKN